LGKIIKIKPLRPAALKAKVIDEARLAQDTLIIKNSCSDNKICVNPNQLITKTAILPITLEVQAKIILTSKLPISTMTSSAISNKSYSNQLSKIQTNPNLYKSLSLRQFDTDIINFDFRARISRVLEEEEVEEEVEELEDF
jgi:hypothetical protein